MRSSDPYRRTILLTPGLSGRDGISEMSRQIVAALEDALSPDAVHVWSLMDEPSALPRRRGASGSRRRFARWGIESGLTSAAGTLVVAVHCHLAPVAIPMMLRGARLIQWLIGIEGWTRLDRLEAHALRRARSLVAISRHTSKRFLAANPDFAARRLDICALAAPDRPTSSEASARQTLGPPPAGRSLAEARRAKAGFALIVARLSANERYKGHDLLLDVWPRVRARVPGANLVVVGEGDDRLRLEARAASAGLGVCVEFVGRASDDVLHGLYERCAFFVMPSRDEGFGLVFLEAMRAGKACIGARGAAEEIIEDGVTGLIVDPDRPEILSGAVIRLFEETRVREDMGRAGAARAAREFDKAAFHGRVKVLLKPD